MNELCTSVVEHLARRGFESVFVATREEALALVLREAESAQSIGWGGSETIKEIGARDALVASGKEIRDHRSDCDLFLLSANAVTGDGRIVNIDGNGNRIAASIHGPKRVVYVIGENKLVAGGLDDAVQRIKREACPPNAKRLARRTPCALTGKCADCVSPDRVCKVMAVFDRKPTGISAKVIVVGQKLGY